MRRNGVGRYGLGIVAGVTVAGCSHHTPSLVGTWTDSVTSSQGPQQITLVFTSNGAETMTVQMQAKGMRFQIVSSGNYHLSGNELTQTLSMATMNGKSMGPNAGYTTPRTFDYTLSGNTLTLVRVDNSQMRLVLTRQGGS